MGEPPKQSVYPRLLNLTIQSFCLQMSNIQNLVVLLELNVDRFAKEFLNLIKPMTNNLPDRFKIFFFVNNKTIKLDKSNFQFDANYYWDHPAELGLDLQYLTQEKASTIVDFLILEETTIFLRLWSLVDIAIPAIKTALSRLSKYRPPEVALLTQHDELGIEIQNQDCHVVEYKLQRQLAYHYARTGQTEELSKAQNKALEIVETSGFTKLDTIKLKGAIWGESAQDFKYEKKLDDAIRSLKTQKSIYEQIEHVFIKPELSVNAHNLGACYRIKRDYKEALRHLNKSIAIAEELKDTDNEIETRPELGRTYIDLEDKTSAMTQFNIIEQKLPLEPCGRGLYIKGYNLSIYCFLYNDFEDSINTNFFTQRAFEIFSILGAHEDIEKNRKATQKIVL